jgi:Zn-dependent M16 (insulinase) family peptidase
MLLDMTGDSTVLETAMTSAEDFLMNKLPLDLGKQASPTPDFRSEEHPWIAAAREEMLKFNPIQNEGIVVSTQVAYVGEGGQLYESGDEVSGGTSVVSHYLSTGYMWDVIRAKNGAYGAYSHFTQTDGVATLYTYRDPNSPDTTLSLFDAAADTILNDASTETLSRNNNAAITTAVIGTIGSLDGSALSANDAGYVALVRYLRGESSVARQHWRNQVLATSAEDFVDFANRMKSWKNPSQAIVASESAFADMKARVGVELSLFKAQR